MSDQRLIPTLLDLLEKDISTVWEHSNTTHDRVVAAVAPALTSPEPEQDESKLAMEPGEYSSPVSELAGRLRDLCTQVSRLHRPLDSLDELTNRIEL